MPKCQSHSVREWWNLTSASVFIWLLNVWYSWDRVRACSASVAKKKVRFWTCMSVWPSVRIDLEDGAWESVYSVPACVNVSVCDSSQSRFTVAGLLIAFKHVVFCWVVWLGHVTPLSTVAINKTSQKSGLDGADQKVLQSFRKDIASFFARLQVPWCIFSYDWKNNTDSQELDCEFVFSFLPKTGNYFRRRLPAKYFPSSSWHSQMLFLLE